MSEKYVFNENKHKNIKLKNDQLKKQKVHMKIDVFFSYIRLDEKF